MRPALFTFLLVLFSSMAQANEKTNALRVTIGPEQMTIKSGHHPILVSLNIKNISKTDVQILIAYQPGFGSPYSIKVWRDKKSVDREPYAWEQPGLTQAQRALIQTEYFCCRGATTILSPGTSADASFSVDEVFDLTQPGIYEIQYVGDFALPPRERQKEKDAVDEDDGREGSQAGEKNQGFRKETIGSNKIKIVVTK